MIRHTLMAFASCAILSSQAQLSGTYTIGGPSPDYATFTTAVADLVAQGVSAPVLFTVANGTYNEQVTIAAFAGASQVNTVTFTSASGDSSAVVIETFGNNLQLQSTAHLRFERITFRALQGALSRLVFIRGATQRISFEGCVFDGFATASLFNSRLVECENISANPYLTFHGNRFSGGQQGLYLAGQNPNSPAVGGVVENNHFTGQTRGGINAVFQNGVVIAGNTVESVDGLSSYAGISLAQSSSGCRIERNRVDTDRGLGIRIEATVATSTAPVIVANNMIANGCSTDESAGISAFQSNWLRVDYNSVNLVGSDTSSAAFRMSGLAGQDDTVLRNNILRNAAGGRALRIDGIIPLAASDHNDLLANTAVLCRFNGEHADLAAWQSATGWDANSVSVDPGFLSDTDLHITTGAVQGMAMVLDITEDFDGEQRDPVAPDIGADEADMSVDVGSVSRPASLLAYPNPTAGLITVEGRCGTYEVLDALGRERYLPRAWLGNGMVQLDLGSLPKGSYQIRCATGGPHVRVVLQ